MARILVVDDEEPIRKMMRDMLEREDHEVLDAANGVEALTLFRIARTDLVITNILMPEKEGLETIRDLRGEFPDIPIIAMSGGGQLGSLNYLEVARTLGAQQTIHKPFNRQELLDAIDRVLSDVA